MAVEPSKQSVVPENPDHVGRGLLNTKEAAHWLGISAKEMQRMRREGRGPRAAKLGHRIVRYPIDELTRWVAERMVSNTAEGRALNRREGGAA